jgi:hypothetical protein
MFPYVHWPAHPPAMEAIWNDCDFIKTWIFITVTFEVSVVASDQLKCHNDNSIVVLMNMFWYYLSRSCDLYCRVITGDKNMSHFIIMVDLNDLHLGLIKNLCRSQRLIEDHMTYLSNIKTYSLVVYIWIPLGYLVFLLNTIQFLHCEVQKREHASATCCVGRFK